MNKIKAHLDNIALSHSIFALPFAYMGSFLAVGGTPTFQQLFWVTLAMIGARSAALAFNNLIDLKYDRLHPRFTRRPMVTGAIKPWEAVVFIAVSLTVFLLAASRLHPRCLELWPLAVIPLAVYPYMKRISWTCHLVLGLALACAPLGAWIAVRGEVAVPIVLLGAAVALWIAGFDCIYGCQDVAFDKTYRLHSMPVRFGIAGALRLSRFMHFISAACFVAVGLLLHLGGIYYLGVILAVFVLIYQHSIINEQDVSRVNQVYFMRNGLVSILVFVFTVFSLVFSK